MTQQKERNMDMF